MNLWPVEHFFHHFGVPLVLGQNWLLTKNTYCSYMLHAGPLLGVTPEWFGFLSPLFCAVVGIYDSKLDWFEYRLDWFEYLCYKYWIAQYGNCALHLFCPYNF